jgi:septal ring-binding cell division protein DamX
MPAVSAKQKRFMQAAAHNPEFAKKASVPTDVAKEYSVASKGQKFGPNTRADLQGINKPKTDHGSMNLFKKGGAMKDDMMQDKAMAKKAVGMHEAQLHGGKKSNMTKLAKGGSASSRADGCAMKGKTKGTMISMKSGGMSC